MADETTSQERSERATPRRREQSRAEGRIARSPELTAAAGLLAGAALLATLAGPMLADYSARTLRECTRMLSAGPMSAGTAASLLRTGTTGLIVALLPLLVGLAAAIVGIGLVQSRGLITWKPIAPKLSHLNPWAGVKRLVNAEAAFNLVKSLAKLAALALVTALVLSRSWPELVALARTGPAETVEVTQVLMFRLAFMAGLTFLAIALADYGFQVWRVEKSMRMTRQEVVREYRETEGDPLIKARILSIMRTRARQRMLQQVPSADVVVVNPTEIAVALKYDTDLAPAPVVVAMGRRKLAERIRALASAARVPVIENRPVARALIATAVVGKPIPPALYAAVAEILAFVYRQRAVLPPGLLRERDAGRTA